MSTRTVADLLHESLAPLVEAHRDGREPTEQDWLGADYALRISTLASEHESSSEGSSRDGDTSGTGFNDRRRIAPAPPGWCLARIVLPCNRHNGRNRGRKAATMKTKRLPYRQGDVLMIPVAGIPKRLKKIHKDNGRVILAYGEVTGHAHAVLGDVEFLQADMDEMSDRFLRVLDDHGAQVVHDEHDTITLPQGDYIIRRQREYTPEQIRNVAD